MASVHEDLEDRLARASAAAERGPPLEWQQTRRVIAVDLPGFGASPSGEEAADAFAQLLPGLIDEHHSNGGI